MVLNQSASSRPTLSVWLLSLLRDADGDAHNIDTVDDCNGRNVVDE